MGKILIAKNKQARREGVDLSLKTPGTKGHARLLKRLTITPGSKGSGKTYRPKMSEYGRQLREKQKLKRVYNVSERKMSAYFENAVESHGNTIDFIIQSLELRLDNVLYRGGFAPTRAAARQLVSHGHVLVNGKKITIPSYRLAISDAVSYRKKDTREIPYILAVIEDKNRQIPAWVERKDDTITIMTLPSQETYAEPIDLPMVIEFYSKL